MGRAKDIKNDNAFMLKTTICFKGDAKILIQEMGHNKSALVNYVVNQAIRSGTITDFLKEHFEQKKVNEIMKNYSVEQVDTRKTKNSEKELFSEKKETERLKIGGNSGFDY